MKFLQELLQEMNVQQQSELEAQSDLNALGVNDTKAGAGRTLFLKRKKEKASQLKNLEQSDEPLDRQIAQLRRQLAILIQKKQAKLKQKLSQSSI